MSLGRRRLTAVGIGVIAVAAIAVTFGSGALGALAAAVGTAALGAAVAYFLDKRFWRGLERGLGVVRDPLHIQVLTDVDSFESGVVHVPRFVLPDDPDALPPPPAGDRPEGRYQWAHALGGVDAGESLVRVIVSGTSESPVVLHRLHVKVVSRKPPLEGSLISYLGLGAPMSVRYFDVDLDADPPSLDYRTADGQTVERFPFRVAETEDEVLDIYAHTFRSDCEWMLELTYTSDGVTGARNIDDQGMPFRTTAADGPGLVVVYWTENRWQTYVPPQ
jgi:hypothetical protein